MNIEKPFYLYKDDVFRLALSYTHSVQEAEDVCQSVFLKLLEQKELAPGKERAWLMQVTVNQCRNLLRSTWWRKTDPMEEAASLLQEQNRYPEVYEALMTLAPKYRVVVFLRYYEQCTTAEIGELLRLSQTAVTTRLSRAKKMLQELLKEEAV